MSTDRERYADHAKVTATGDGLDDAAIVLEYNADNGEWSLNAYDREGELGAYLSSDNSEDRDELLALGRAIVEALDPVPDPGQRLEAWDSIANHPFFAPAFDAEKPLIDAMLEQLDGLCTCESEPATLELVGDTTLPLDVEIRTIALGAAVRVIDQAGGSLVDGAAKIERFLRGEADEEQTAAEKPRWTVGQELTVEDLDELPIGTTVVDGDGDHAVRRPDGRPYAGTIEPRRWTRDLSGDPARLPSPVVAAYPPVTLVSLP